MPGVRKPELQTAREPVADAQGNRDPSAGASPGYDEQQPTGVAAAREPGARRRPDNEEGGVGRDVTASPNADSDPPQSPSRAASAKARKRRG